MLLLIDLIVASALGFFFMTRIAPIAREVYLYFYCAAGIFFLISILAVMPAVFSLTEGAWSVFFVSLTIPSLLLGFFFLVQGSEARADVRAYKLQQKLQQPIDSLEAEKGLDWKKIETWLSEQKNSKTS